ncbi:MAG TPA: NAD(P)-dependent oxidoreductase [Candidatus Hydrogenedentes bacterium]|nr:NAD(P)-dependent oxidoreductase [Candidatus Hydrogenedentota bacterium]HOL76073.1 NAD(P)-dependent oxidoreductase [Candidatus Hydrogenedentota bacterium]HPO84687.1 NAD(P)-dependent oxidoreductase [Candidatus Hydrogenedentota bacterium]
MRILVTGSSGKLGSALVAKFAAEHEIVQMDVKAPANEAQSNIGPVYVGSVTDRTLVEEAMDGVEAVIHCGAIPSNFPPFNELVHTNVVGTINLLEAAGKSAALRNFLFISTIRVHGVLEEPNDDFMPKFLPFDESHPYLTIEYYGGSKWQAEHWCRCYVRRFRKPVVVFRPTMIVPLVREEKFQAGPAPERPSLNEYVGTSDVVEAIRLGLSYEPADGFDVFLLHAEDQRSTTPSLELAERWFHGIPTDKEKLSRCDGFGAFVDCSHAQETLGWQARFRCTRR